MDIEMKRVDSASRRAGCSVLVLTAFYVVHWIAVFAIAPGKKLTSGNVTAGIAIASAATFAFAWSGITVWRGGRLVGAFVVAAICTLGGAISGILSAKPGGPGVPLFTVLQILIVLWSLLTFAALIHAYDARRQR